MRNDKNIIETIYILSVIAAFGLLFYANAEQQEIPDGTVVRLGIGKLFYLPCGIALACSMVMKGAKDKIGKYLNYLIFFALLSFLLHPQDSPNVLTWTITRFVMAILCFRNIRSIDPRKFILYLTIVSPIIVLPHYVLTNPFAYGLQRYGGFYGDPNFLAIALNLLIVVCYLSNRVSSKLIFKFASAITILGSIPLILLGVSRAGIFGLCIVIIYILRDLYGHKKSIFVISLIGLLLFTNSIYNRTEKTFQLIESRFTNENDNPNLGAESRLLGMESCINVMYNKPELIPFGIGPGNSIPKLYIYKYYGYRIKYMIHNTFFLYLYELGIFALFCYLAIYYHTFKKLKRERSYLLIGLLFTNAFSLFTLPGVTFMPSWILLFFLSNVNLQDKLNKSK